MRPCHREARSGLDDSLHHAVEAPIHAIERNSGLLEAVAMRHERCEIDLSARGEGQGAVRGAARALLHQDAQAFVAQGGVDETGMVVAGYAHDYHLATGLADLAALSRGV